MRKVFSIKPNQTSSRTSLEAQSADPSEGTAHSFLLPMKAEGSSRASLPTSSPYRVRMSATGYSPADSPDKSWTINLAKILNNRTGCPAALGKPVPLPSTQGGAVAYSTVFPTGHIPLPCMDATAVDLMKQYVPLANRSDGAFQQSVNASTRSGQLTARIDHKLTSNQQLQLYYYFNDSMVLNPFTMNSNSGADLPKFGATNAFRYQQWNVSHSWLLNPEIVNEFRFTYLREGLGKFNSPQHTNLVAGSCKAA